jgi:hypothetical protein
MYFETYGSHKPGLGARVNPEHPFAKGHLLSVLFNDPQNALPAVLWGSVTPRTVTATLSGSISWASNREGSALNFADKDARLDLGPDFFGSAATVLLIRRKTDTTLREGNAFGVCNSATGGSELCAAHVPYTDGTVYWYCGQTFAPYLLTAPGLSFSTAPERWVFTAGPQGSSIWQNGVKVATQSSPVFRVPAPASWNVYLNDSGHSSNHGDQQDMNFFGAYDYQWSDDLCQWWSAEPYAHLYADTWQRSYFLLGDLAAAATVRGTVFRSPIFGSPIFGPGAL